MKPATAVTLEDCIPTAKVTNIYQQTALGSQSTDKLEGTISSIAGYEKMGKDNVGPAPTKAHAEKVVGETEALSYLAASPDEQLKAALDKAERGTEEYTDAILAILRAQHQKKKDEFAKYKSKSYLEGTAKYKEYRDISRLLSLTEQKAAHTERSTKAQSEGKTIAPFNAEKATSLATLTDKYPMSVPDLNKRLVKLAEDPVVNLKLQRKKLKMPVARKAKDVSPYIAAVTALVAKSFVQRAVTRATASKLKTVGVAHAVPVVGGKTSLADLFDMMPAAKQTFVYLTKQTAEKERVNNLLKTVEKIKSKDVEVNIKGNKKPTWMASKASGLLGAKLYKLSNFKNSKFSSDFKKLVSTLCREFIETIFECILTRVDKSIQLKDAVAEVKSLAIVGGVRSEMEALDAAGRSGIDTSNKQTLERKEAKNATKEPEPKQESAKEEEDDELLEE